MTEPNVILQAADFLGGSYDDMAPRMWSAPERAINLTTKQRNLEPK